MEQEAQIAETRGRHQRALVEFLSADIDLARTYLNTARIDAQTDPAHARKLMANAVTALRAVRSLQGRIEDPAEWARVNDKANDLESELKSFPI